MICADCGHEHPWAEQSPGFVIFDVCAECRCETGVPA